MQNWAGTENPVVPSKKLWEGRGKSCRGLKKPCIFIAQTHRPMLILLNHMHTLARRAPPNFLRDSVWVAIVQTLTALAAEKKEKTTVAL